MTETEARLIGQAVGVEVAAVMTAYGDSLIRILELVEQLAHRVDRLELEQRYRQPSVLWQPPVSSRES